MRNLILLATLAALTPPAFAATTHGMTFREFVTARGCIINDVKGADGSVLYSNFIGGCKAVAEWTSVGQKLVDQDNDPATPSVQVSDN